MTEQFKRDVKALLEYGWEDERRDFLENHLPDNGSPHLAEEQVGRLVSGRVSPARATSSRRCGGRSWPCGGRATTPAVRAGRRTGSRSGSAKSAATSWGRPTNPMNARPLETGMATALLTITDPATGKSLAVEVEGCGGFLNIRPAGYGNPVSLDYH
jgi:hypothetical protein